MNKAKELLSSLDVREKLIPGKHKISHVEKLMLSKVLIIHLAQGWRRGGLRGYFVNTS